MEIHIEADIGDGPVQLTAGLWPLVQWERKFNTKASKLADSIGLEDLAYLAYETSKQQKIVVPATFDDYCKKIVAIRLVSGSADPTKAAASDGD